MFRYTINDDFGTPENAFIVCTFWMINALYLLGEKEKARRMFENVLKSRNHLGLLAAGIAVYAGRTNRELPTSLFTSRADSIGIHARDRV
jgi:GH15 family glucan-1,4-alpha-glucosidase